MSALLFATAFFTFAAQKPIELNVNVKDGETIIGDRQFKVTVVAKNPVTQVEFYVGSDLRDNDTSTPYQFSLDSLGEEDGNLKLTFKAYTNAGESASKSVTVKIDNGVSKGADYHVKKGIEALQNGDYASAIVSGRIALKADPKSNPARLVLARANLGLGALDKAQKFAEDAVEQDGQYTDGLDLLAAIDLRRATRTLNRAGGSQTDTANQIKAAYQRAVESRIKSLSIALDRVGPLTDTNVIPYADAAIRAGRYSVAINALEPAFKKDVTRAEIANRLAFAELRANRPVDAFNTLNEFKKFTPLDAYGQALMAVIKADTGDDAGADEAIRNALLADADDLGVQTAQAYLALKRSKDDVLAKLAENLTNNQASNSDVLYYVSALDNRLKRYEEARRAFEQSVLAEPANYDAYIEGGLGALVLTQGDSFDADQKKVLYDSARTLFETALVARPESAEALSGVVVCALYQGNLDDAVKFGQAAVAAAPASPVAHFALAAAYSKAAASPGRGAAESSRYISLANDENTKAGRLDVKNLGGRGIPDATAVYRYLTTTGRHAVLTAPK